MKPTLNYLRIMALALCAWCLAGTAQAQFTNGDFQLPGINSCGAGTGWTTGVSSQRAQYTNAPSGTNFWMDITPCPVSGNGAWVQQTVTTVPGRTYCVSFDLGTWPVWNFDAGVNVSINGSPLGGRIWHAVFGAGPGPHFERMTTCLFTATGTSTTVRFTGNAKDLTNPSNPNPMPGIIALDNVELHEVGHFNTAAGVRCNEFCFSMADSIDAATLASVEWLIDDEVKASNTTDFCWVFPRNVPRTVRLSYLVTSSCGTDTVNIDTLINAADTCGCEYDSNVVLRQTFRPCNEYKFNLDFTTGYSSSFTQWTVDGIGVTGTTDSLDFSGYDTGYHTICVTTIGGLEADADNMCCTKICTQIYIQPADTVYRAIEYCELTNPSGPYYDPCSDCTGGYYELYTNGVLVSNSGCPSVILNSTSVLYCYDVVNGVNCLRKVIYFTVTPKALSVTNNPAVNLEVCQGTVAYTPASCGPGYSAYIMTGTGGYNQAGPAWPAPVFYLSVGTYTYTAYDYVNCAKCVTTVTVSQKMDYTTCNIILSDCNDIEDETYLASLMNNCPDCQQTLLNATSTGPWMRMSHDPNTGLLVMQRTYTDATNCTICTVTFSITNQFVPVTLMPLNGQPCVTIFNFNLPPCLQNKLIKVYQEGIPAPVTVDPNVGFQLCCPGANGVVNPIYYLYSDDDPCCVMRIGLSCIPHIAPPQQGSSGSPAGQTKESLIASGLKIVPNPASSIFQVMPEDGFEVYKNISVTDINGKTILTKSDADSKSIIDISAYGSGTYFVKVTRASGDIAMLKLISLKN